MLIASFVAAAVASVSILLLLYSTAKRSNLGILFIVFACTLPMCWVMYHYVRVPIDHWLLGWFPDGKALFWIRAAYAPLTEEPAKLWPLIIPFVRRSLTRQNLALFAIALGGGFAVGEIFTVADLIQSRLPDVAQLPWHHLSGFINERLMTVGIHSGMTVSALLVMHRGAGLITGLLVSMCLHFIVNLPIALSKSGWFEFSPAITQFVLWIWISFCFISAVVFLLWLSGADQLSALSIYGNACCPSCGSQYSRSILNGLNFGFDLRYEPCAACRKWHWTRRSEKTDTSQSVSTGNAVDPK